MDFDYSDEQKLLAKTVADFCKTRSPITRFRALRDADGPGWDPAIWREMGELGWLAIPFAEDIGGLGGSFVDAAIILEQLGTALVPEPYLASVVLGGYALAQAGSAEQCERFLAPMLEGHTSVALAWAERGSRYAPSRAACTAEADGDGWLLRGRKHFVLGGHVADQLIVSATTSEGLALFVVDRGAAKLRTSTAGLIDGHRGAHVELDGVRVSDDRKLSANPAAEVLARTLDYGAAAAVAEGLGVAATMLAMTKDYLGTREQFGVKIGTFQALQHRTVDMFIEVELLRSLSMEAMIRADEAEPEQRRAAISAAKHQLGEGGQFVSRQAVQLHGGIGVTDEADIGLFFKRMQALSSICGDAEHHLARYVSLTSSHVSSPSASAAASR